MGWSGPGRLGSRLRRNHVPAASLKRSIATFGAVSGSSGPGAATLPAHAVNAVATAIAASWARSRIGPA